MCNIAHIINSVDRTYWPISSFQVRENEDGAQDMSTERTKYILCFLCGRKAVSKYCSDEAK